MRLRILATVLLFTAALSACQEKKQKMSDSEIKAKVDSIVGVRVEEINKQSMDDLDKRMSIEVKTKTDSIVDAYKQVQSGTPAATVTPTPQP